MGVARSERPHGQDRSMPGWVNCQPSPEGEIVMFDFKELFLAQWLKVFDSLLEAQLSEEDDPNIEKLRARYMRMADLAGPDLFQDFMQVALRRLGEKAPEVRDRLIRELGRKGVLLGDASLC